MPQKSFTDRWLKTVKTTKVQEELTDTSFNEKGSFGVVVSRVGTKTFFHHYRVNGKKRRDIVQFNPVQGLEKLAKEREGRESFHTKK